jgi:hypothetical protein
MHRFCSRFTLVALLLAVARVATAQGSPGSIAGRITDRATSAPLGDARIVVVGTQRDTRTNESGQYRLTSVPAGMVRLRVLRLGYRATEQRDLALLLQLGLVQCGQPRRRCRSPFCVGR